MLAIAGNARIFLFQCPVDMRKGIEGLSSLVEQSCPGEIMTGAYFVFINRLKDWIKVLYWDSDGFAIRKTFSQNWLGSDFQTYTQAGELFHQTNHVQNMD